MRRSVPLPESASPSICKSSPCTLSVGLITATVSALRSAVQAAATSSGKVSLPALTTGCSPPGGSLGLGCGELPDTFDRNRPVVFAIELEEHAGGIEHGLAALGAVGARHERHGGKLVEVGVAEHLVEGPRIGGHDLVASPRAPA